MDKKRKNETPKVNENKFYLKITFMICATLLGVLALIGIFWGKEGYLTLGIIILMAIVLGLFVASN